MTNLFENEIKPQRALLAAVDTGDYDVENSIKELYELAESAGVEPVADISQKRDKPDVSTAVGSGMLLEIKDFCENNEIDILIFDMELSPTQIRNIEKELNRQVIDRTMLILDIFALRAKTKAGKLQVELAQLKYLLPRLTGKGVELSRLGAGIGTRGPGETKLETDKRHIRRRMETIKEQLKDIENHRGQLKRRREKDGVITVAIVGYTNAGKSTLMNYLTNAGVLAQDKLFATLDPTSRALKLPDGVTVMLIDTVGLVRRLPHHLVEAFKSTLEEAATADIILNLCDASSPEAQLHLKVTRDLLTEISKENRPIISVLNKWDMVEDESDIPYVEKSVKISAKTGQGVDKLLKVIEENLPVKIKRVTVLLPFDKAGVAAVIREKAQLISEEYTDKGIEIQALLDEQLLNRVKEYIIEF